MYGATLKRVIRDKKQKSHKIAVRSVTIIMSGTGKMRLLEEK